ncbi:MAG: electron transport complex protein RnfC [Candidatus Endobugula sp.]|jgi:electron transport complex protein RnfC
MNQLIATDQWVSRAIGDFPGGIYPPENKTQSMQLPIGELPIPPVLLLPLNQHMGSPAIPIVAVGDHVLRGQKIAEAAGGFSASIHASSSGTVTAIGDYTLPHPSGMSGQCIEITTDGNNTSATFEPCDDYRQLTPQALVQKIRHAGVTGLGGAGFPTAVKLQPKAQYAIDTLILNGTECEPYITADHSLMLYHAEAIIDGALLLAYILGEPKNILFGIEDNKPDAVEAFKRVLNQRDDCERIRILTFPTKYPSGGEKQLIQLLTKKEVPAGTIPANLGIVMQNVGTAVAAYAAVAHGEPLMSRVTTFVGEALNTQRNMLALLGTPVTFALEHLGFVASNNEKLIMGGPMMGFALKSADVPIVKSTNCIIAPSTQELSPQPEAQECIRCGICAEACPASLLPQQLYWYAKAEDYERAQNHNLFDCIECGACSFVCPSNIPLVQYYRSAKGAIKHIEQEKVKADHARQRFEFRKERMAKAEADKVAKREARKKAATEAKRIQAEKLANAEKNADAPAINDATENTAENIKNDPVAAAMARIKAQQNDPVVQRAKLERAVNGAKDRVAKLSEKLHAEPNKKPTANKEEHKDRTASQLKQAELRLQDAEKQLAAHPLKSPAATEPTPHASAPQNKGDNDRPNPTSSKAEGDSPTPQQAQTDDAASSAIERAKANTAALADMSPEDKQRKSITSLEKRLVKAKQRLAEAEKDNSEHIDAFKGGVEKLEQKLADNT